MGLYIHTNLFALNAQRHLANASSALGRAYERLSSGLRINSAADDPAGLALADRLGRDVRVAAQAIRNANDGISALAVGEQALGTVTNILTRMTELASEAATGVVTDAQRVPLEREFALLLEEITRIASTTTFNGVQLLQGGTTIAVQVGLDGSETSRIDIQTVDVSLEALFATDEEPPVEPPVDPPVDEEPVLSVATQEDAQQALDALTDAIATVTQARGILGAQQSRLLSAIDSLRILRENYSAAESRIRDADVAEESANLARAQILQQAATAVLAQANQQPSILLQLLRS